MPTSGNLDSLLKYRYIQILVRGLATYKIYGEVKRLQNFPLEAPELLNLNVWVIFTFEKAYTEPISQLYKISFATPECFDPIVTHSENIQDEVTGLMWFVYTKVLWCLCTQKTFKPSYLMAVSCWWWLLQEITTTTDTQWKFFTTLLSPVLNKRFWFTQRGLSLVCKINYITLHHARLW